MENREIKFRALKEDMSNCNFVYGQLVYDAIGTPRITEVDRSGEGLTFHSCIKRTEGQFTGMFDKNNNLIYEGDILRRINEYDDGCGYDVHLGVVTWDDCHYYSRSIKNELSRSLGNKPETCTYEIIGNIHENPELL
jgi:uncharacterized phage protein (TIGR01671 family)